jgi:uroporphyrinogen-III synthase
MRKVNKSVLKNKRVMITRPEKQSEKLRELVELNGGRALMFPTVEIKTIGIEPDLITNKSADISIFISKNAVDQIDDQILTGLGKSDCVAIGVGTANSLRQRNIAKVSYPVEGIGSEALLDLPLLHEENIRGKNIFLVKGVGGRELIEHTLTARGALVSLLEVYRREKPDINHAKLQNIWQKQSPDVIVITSGEGLENLLEMVPSDNNSYLLDCPLIVISQRLASLAISLGFTVQPVVSRGVDDEAILNAIVSIFEE